MNEDNLIKMDSAVKTQPAEQNNNISHPPTYTDNQFPAQQFGASAANGVAASRTPAHGLPATALSSLPHGYNGTGAVEQDAHIHPELRTLREANAAAGQAPTPNMMQAGAPPPPTPEALGQLTGPMHPSSSVSPSMDDTEMGDASMNDPSRKQAKRELSQSKRAAQNRAAQRAFRQRKELYIKKLEQEVKDMAEMEKANQALQNENYSLRQYVIALQSRLLDAHGEYPQPPPGLVLTPTMPQQHGATAPAPGQAPSNPESVQAPMADITPVPASNASSLEAVAQAVAGLRDQRQLPEQQPQYPHIPVKADQRSEEEARTDEEIGRQLQSETALPSAPM